MSRAVFCKIFIRSNVYKTRKTSVRGFLSQAYLCEEAWQKRLDSELLKNIKMDRYFIDTDKKFGTKRLVSGLDIDLFANSVQHEDELDELEHLLYRFRMTKRSREMMDSTIYAVIRVFLKFKENDSLIKILKDRENYGVFPDFYSYNILMDSFLKQKLYKEAAQIAILMMLQEKFSNSISCILGLYSCQKFLNECSVESLNERLQTPNKEEEPKNYEDEEEVTYVRIPFLRNPCYDDHFDIVNPSHLIGKTFYLIGQKMDNVLGRTYQLIGLAMYEKWEKAIQILELMLKSSTSPLILNEGIQKVKELLNAMPEDEHKTKELFLTKFEVLFHQMENDKKVIEKNLMMTLEEMFLEIPKLEVQDIEAQKQLFLNWETERQSALQQQNKDIDKETRLKIIEEKKDYLFWKEKLLFFFENEDQIMDELRMVEEIIAAKKARKSKKSVDEAYVPPEIIKKKNVKLSRLRRLARVKSLM